MKKRPEDYTLVGLLVAEGLITTNLARPILPASSFDLFGTSSFGGGGGGGSSGGGSDSNNGNEGNEGNEGTEGNEGDESDENNEGNEGNEGNFWSDVGSGLSNLGGNISGGFHQIGGAIGDIGGGEDSGNEGNEGGTVIGSPRAVMAENRDVLFPDHIVSSLRRNPDGSIRRVNKWVGRNRLRATTAT
jgi:hypothetical protein